MNKIKIFLGGYINSQNAQNINCLALAKYLDKNSFEVYTLAKKDGTINIDYLKDSCSISTYNNKLKFTKVWKYIYALYKCDVLYLPKQEKLSTIILLNKVFFRKKLFITIEGLIDDAYINLLEQSKKHSLKKYLNEINSIKHVYSISKFVKKYNFEKIKLDSNEKILYLGTETDFFNSTKSIEKVKLTNAIFIANSMQSKGLDDYLYLAKSFPYINFHIVGKGHNVNFTKIKKEYSNIIVHGSLNPSELKIVLESMNIHIFPSKSEGWGKVTFETASMGIPSIIYDSYGAEEWMTNNKNGFIVKDLNSMKNKLNELINNYKLLQDTSSNAIKLAKEYDWKVLIQTWENEIIKIHSSK